MKLMKFTSEDLMKSMGLKVGDRVKIDTFDYSDFEVREAYDMGHKEIVLADDNGEMFGEYEPVAINSVSWEEEYND